MAATPLRFDGESLRRSRSTGDIPTSEVSRPEPAQTSSSFRYSGSHTRSGDSATSPSSSSSNNASLARTVAFDDQARAAPSPMAHRNTNSTARRPWSPPPTVAEEPDHEAEPAPPPPVVDEPIPLSPQRRLSLYSRVFAFFGYGRGASRARKAFVSLFWNLGWGLVQVVVIITVLALARKRLSPTKPGMNEWDACGRPLGLWSCLWVVRVFLACGLSYWSFRRDRKSQEDVEAGGASPAAGTRAGGRSGARNTANNRAGRPGATTAPAADEPPLPHTKLYARLTLFSSLITLSWFLTAHILEYTSINTCRHSAPYIWWLTFGILCIMYVMVLEVALLGFVVFIVAPILFVFWNILLICIGRHPLQNPSMIKPEIGKLPKAIVDRIPLVIYIPPPPDEPGNGPITVPDAVYAYPPRPVPPKRPSKRRFAFLRLNSKESSKSAGSGEKGQGTNSPAAEPATWEDHWEQGDYPFVRLEGNRAACAICLMDFEEPKRVAGIATPPVENADANTAAVQEIRVERQTVTEAEAHLRLTDAGAGAQPLRLLTCGHVFHQTCLDPWLIDVSGRCPVCQRSVEVPEPSKRRKPARRTQTQ